MESTAQISEEKQAQVSRQSREVPGGKEQQARFRMYCNTYHNTFTKASESKPSDSYSCGNFMNMLSLFCDKSEYMRFAQKFSPLKVYDLNVVSMFNAQHKNRSVMNFMDSSFPNKIRFFFVSLRERLEPKRFYHFNSLIKLNSKISVKAQFQAFKFNDRQLKRLVSNFRHVKVLGIEFCELSIPKIPNFSKALQNCKINQLSLYGCGATHLSDWDYSLDQFKNLIKGLASSPDLKPSLTSVDIHDCQIDQYTAEGIFARNDLEGVEIITGQ
ncbi:unnamed protein product [Moneuplotes crassus]|uniref:Uncharacterized protein n=1 Tax=Euplotes crassus TaxID=5936 RepID=A0AAD1XFN5_EUPCR|nr:unnamed protein product [Moneuplotes crassus]